MSDIKKEIEELRARLAELTAKIDAGDELIELDYDAFVLIEPGSFVMGSDRNSQAEGPAHKVTIPEPYYMGKYLITQHQWESVMGHNPSRFTGGGDLPVECVSFYDAQDFIDKLNQRRDGWIYSLPTEAEWEYACRAGTDTTYFWGNDVGNIDEYAWYYENSEGRTHPVGEKKPNPWGLYDMVGNVWVWCQDRWHATYEGAPTDGSAWL